MYIFFLCLDSVHFIEPDTTPSTAMDWIHQITGAHSKRPLWQVVLSHPLVTNVTHNPLNLALLALLLYLLIPALWPKSTRAPSIAVAREPQSLDTYNWLPPHHPPSTEWRTYTPKTLALFDGTQQGGKRDRKILLSIDGHVFDVTSGGRFYGPSESEADRPKSTAAAAAAALQT